jgi:hypothetical protein
MDSSASADAQPKKFHEYDLKYLSGHLAIENGHWWFYKEHKDKSLRLRLHLMPVDERALKDYDGKEVPGWFVGNIRAVEDNFVLVKFLRFESPEAYPYIFDLKRDGDTHVVLSAFRRLKVTEMQDGMTEVMALTR